jgi:hypothetical protein
MGEGKQTAFARLAVVETLPDREADYIGETFVKADNGITISHLANYNPAERRAYAQLFAAAPKLLLALEQMQLAFGAYASTARANGCYPTQREVNTAQRLARELARTAIAEATGVPHGS